MEAQVRRAHPPSLSPCPLGRSAPGRPIPVLTDRFGRVQVLRYGIHFPSVGSIGASMTEPTRDESLTAFVEDIGPDRHHDHAVEHPAGDGLVKPGYDDRLANNDL